MSCHENAKKRRFHGWTNPVLISVPEAPLPSLRIQTWLKTELVKYQESILTKEHKLAELQVVRLEFEKLSGLEKLSMYMSCPDDSVCW
jgi:hypothetical protein